MNEVLRRSGMKKGYDMGETLALLDQLNSVILAYKESGLTLYDAMVQLESIRSSACLSKCRNGFRIEDVDKYIEELQRSINED